MATTAKSKTVTYADLINAADLEGMKKAEQAHADLDALREQIDKWGEEHSEAASRLRWMESSFVRGNDAVSVEDYALAIARAKRAEFLAHAHTETEDKRIQIAERKLPPTEKKLAKAVAAALETLLPGIPVLTTFGKVPDPTEADLPVAVVSRNKPTGIGWAGLVPSGGLPHFLNGEVTVHMFKLPMHKDLDPARLAAHLVKQGIKIRSEDSLRQREILTHNRKGYEMQSTRLDITLVRNPEVPAEVIEEVHKTAASRSFGQRA
jgi:hypothetical protein